MVRATALAHAQHDSDLVGYFGGSQPASFYIRLWSKKSGVRSFSYIDCTVNRT